LASSAVLPGRDPVPWLHFCGPSHATKPLKFDVRFTRELSLIRPTQSASRVKYMALAPNDDEAVYQKEEVTSFGEQGAQKRAFRLFSPDPQSSGPAPKGLQRLGFSPLRQGWESVPSWKSGGSGRGSNRKWLDSFQLHCSSIPRQAYHYPLRLIFRWSQPALPKASPEKASDGTGARPPDGKLQRNSALPLTSPHQKLLSSAWRACSSLQWAGTQTAISAPSRSTTA